MPGARSKGPPMSIEDAKHAGQYRDAFRNVDEKKAWVEDCQKTIKAMVDGLTILKTKIPPDNKAVIFALDGAIIGLVHARVMLKDSGL